MIGPFPAGSPDAEVGVAAPSRSAAAPSPVPSPVTALPPAQRERGATAHPKKERCCFREGAPSPARGGREGGTRGGGSGRGLRRCYNPPRMETPGLEDFPRTRKAIEK